MRKVAAVLTALVYFGLSNCCSTQAVLAGELHHHFPSAAAVHEEHHDHDCGHDDHEEAPAHHRHSSDEPAPCCTTFNELGVTLPSAPRILAKAAISAVAPIFQVVTAYASLPQAQGYFSRTDHGPPKPAIQEASRFGRAPRAPPAVVL